MPENIRASIFISYSHEDEDFVHRLINDLRASGYSIVTVIEDLRETQAGVQEITRVLKGCEAFVLVVSPDSVASEWVNKETFVAIGLGKQIIPIIHRTADLPVHLADAQPLDFQGSYGDAFHKLREVLPLPPVGTQGSASVSGRECTPPNGATLLPPRLEPQPIPMLFVQRDRLVSRLLRLLERYRTVVLVGPAGYGKSTIATAVLEKLAWPFVYYRFAPAEDVSVLLETLILQGTRSSGEVGRDESQLATTRADQVQRILRSFEGTADAVRVVAQHLGQVWTEAEKALVVLDDYHFVSEEDSTSLRDSYNTVLKLLANGLPQKVRVLITSRESIEAVKGVATAYETPICGFSSKETSEYLTMAYPGAEFSGTFVRRVHRKLEGWPLGLTYFVQLAPLSAQEDEIKEVFESLHRGRLPFTELFGRLVIDRLNPEDRKFLIETSVVPELNEELCRKITGRPDAGKILIRLTRQQNSFVFSFEGERFWCRCHDLFRDILRHELKRDPLRERQALNRAREYYVSERLWAQAITYAIAGQEFDTALQYLISFGEDFYQQAQYAALLNWIDPLIAQFRANPEAIAWLSYMKGRILERRGRREEASGFISQSARAYEEIGDLVQWARSTNKLGTISLRLRDYPQAKSYFLESYRTRLDVDDRIGQAQALYSLGDVYWHLGRFQEARTYWQESLRVNRSEGHQEGIAIVEVMLGKLEKAIGELEAAHSLFIDALTLNEELGNVFGVQVVQSFIGELALLRGELGEALKYCRLSQHSAERMANYLGVAINSKLIGEALVLQGEFAEAEEHLARAMRINERMHDRRGRAIVMITNALVLRHRGEIERTDLVLREATRLARTTGDILVLMNALVALGEVKALMGHFSEAQKLLAEAEQSLSDLDGAWCTALISRAQGILQRQRQDGQMGVVSLERALDAFRKMGGKYELARSHLEIAEALGILGNKAASQYHLESARNLIKRHGFGYLDARYRLIKDKSQDLGPQ